MKIEWTTRALRALFKTLKYMDKNFGTNSVIKLQNEIDSSINTIRKNPEIMPQEPLLESRKTLYRSYIVNRINKLIYYVENNTLYIADIWDSRMNPKTLERRVR